MSKKTEFCDGIEVGDILVLDPDMWVATDRGVRRAVVIKTVTRTSTREAPLLTIVDQDFRINRFDAGHFYKDPPAKEMTVSEISEELGYEVKIVK